MNPPNGDTNVRLSDLEARSDHSAARMDRIEAVLEQATQIGLKNSMEIAAFNEMLRRKAEENQKQNEAFQLKVEASRRDFEAFRRESEEAGRRHDREIAEIREIQRHGDEKLNALIHVVDDLIRKRPPLQ